MKITDLPLEKRLIQFAEECAEASQAALKLVRAMDGDTPVPEHRAAVNLLEEIADVYVTALALDPDPMTIEAIARDGRGESVNYHAPKGTRLATPL